MKKKRQIALINYFAKMQPDEVLRIGYEEMLDLPLRVVMAVDEIQDIRRAELAGEPFPEMGWVRIDHQGPTH